MDNDYCHSCGEETDPEADFCSNCGTELTIVNPESNTNDLPFGPGVYIIFFFVAGFLIPVGSGSATEEPELGGVAVLLGVVILFATTLSLKDHKDAFLKLATYRSSLTNTQSGLFVLLIGVLTFVVFGFIDFVNTDADILDPEMSSALFGMSLGLVMIYVALMMLYFSRARPRDN